MDLQRVFHHPPRAIIGTCKAVAQVG